MWRLSVIATLAGCGRLDFDPGGGDAGSTDDGIATSDGLAATCTTFGGPTAVGGINTTINDWAPAISPDGKTLLFSRQMVGIESLFVATLVSGTTFGGVTQLAVLNSNNGSGSATWFPDGSGIYFESDRLVQFAYRLYSSTFDGTSFSTPMEVPELVSELVIGPALSPNGLELFYSDQTNQSSIRRATRATLTSPWVPQGYVMELDVLGDGYPTLSPDGLTIYFESERDNTGGYIYQATRPTLDAPFGTVTELTVVDDGTAAGDPGLSADGRSLYFTAERAGGLGLADIYVATCQ